ncbi:MAG: amino acid ABC transporter permease [Rhizobiaceae bacterium]|jgi:polar amino acid transport system permease protein
MKEGSQAKKPTALPVLLEITPRAPVLRLRLWHGIALFGAVLLFSSVAGAQTGAGEPSPIAVIIKWMPLLLRGFLFNLLLSVLSMALGTLLGVPLGLLQLSEVRALRVCAWGFTQFFRNAPWLVLLFFAMYLVPYQFSLGGVTVPFPDWIKAVIGFALPVMANVAEIVRGAVQSLPGGQWEAAESLAFTRRQTMWMIILPQCLQRMLPPWMNVYSLITMSTVLASIVGINEMLTLTAQVHNAEGGRPDLLAPLYGFALLCFFVYCYPINLWTVRLERRFHVRS